MVHDFLAKKGLSPHTLSATLLVAGTCIGGGMLALPVACAPSGFFPSMAMMLLTWVMMTLTALCLVEIGFWMEKDDAHIVSMSRKFLGPLGRFVSRALFLFISYASLVAYIGGSAQLLSHALSAISSGKVVLSHVESSFLFTILFAPFIFLSHHALGKANSMLFLLMVAAYGIIISLGIGHIEEQLIMHMDWKKAPAAIPLLLTSFSFQTMVPSLHPYLHHNKRSLRIAVVMGTALAFLVYLLWQLVVLGSVPLDGPHGLLKALEQSEPATYSLGHITQNPLLAGASLLFAFFSLVTSFFGISMGLYDFLKDGLNLSISSTKKTLILGSLVLIPSLVFAISYERVFLTALDLSGGFGDTILNGLLPIAMFWIGWNIYGTGRLKKRLKVGLLVLAGLYLGALGLETATRCSFGNTHYESKVRDIVEEELERKEAPCQ